MKYLPLKIELLEDLHIGTGTGWGDINAIQVRDRRGWPVLPASHIKGLLRDVANEWHRIDSSVFTREAVESLFGRPGGGQGCVQLTSAYLCESNQSNTLLWGSTQIDANGKAADQSLRFVEYIPAGSCFRMQVMLPTDSEDRFKLIIARCRRLGGGRNRGYGLVRWSLDDIPQSSEFSLVGSSATPARLRLLLRNLDPICLALTGHPGNLISSESFIRGRSLRGAFVAACLTLERYDLAQKLLADTLSWGNALPLPSTELDVCALTTLDVLPIPLSIGTPKAKISSASLPLWAQRQKSTTFGSRDEIDQISPAQERRQEEKPKEEKLKRPGAGEFLFRSGVNLDWQRYRPQILERLHARVPSRENNYEQALFSTEEIAERTLFVADLIVADSAQRDTLIEVLRILTHQWLRIGRGGRPLAIESMVWLPMTGHGSATDSSFTMLLESELIVRDGFGNFYDQLDAKIVAELVGLPNSCVETDPVFSESCDLFGFNAATGLQRLAQRAIKAGSVIRISGSDALKVRAGLVSRRVLGECPEEGFGRFRLDHLPAPTQLSQNAEVPATVEPSREEQLCLKAREWSDKFGQMFAAPSLSQWGDFRSRVHASRCWDELEAIFKDISKAKERHGGKSWKGFAESAEYADFCNACKEISLESLADAQTFLDYFVRWQCACSNRKSTEEGGL